MLEVAVTRVEKEMRFPLDALDRFEVGAWLPPGGDPADGKQVLVWVGNRELSDESMKHATAQPEQVGDYAVHRRSRSRGDERIVKVRPELMVFGSAEFIEATLLGKSKAAPMSPDLMSLLSGREGRVAWHLSVQVLVTGDEDDTHLQLRAILRHVKEGDGVGVSQNAFDGMVAKLREDQRMRMIQPLLKKASATRDRTDAVLQVDLGRSRDAVGNIAGRRPRPGCLRFRSGYAPPDPSPLRSMHIPPERSRRRRRLRFLVAAAGAACALLLLVSCVTSQPARSGVVSDSAGRPIADAYVLAVHWGADHGGLVHPGSHVCAGELLRTDAAGRYEIGSRWLFHSPMVDELRPVVVAVYSPERRVGLHDPTWDRFDVVLPDGAGAQGWHEALVGLREIANRDNRTWLELPVEAQTELHELIIRELERFLVEHGDESRSEGRPWRDAVQQQLEWDKAHRPG